MAQKTDIQELFKWATSNTTASQAKSSNYTLQQDLPLSKFLEDEGAAFAAALQNLDPNYWKQLLDKMKTDGPLKAEDFGAFTDGFGNTTDALAGYIQEQIDGTLASGKDISADLKTLIDKYGTKAENILDRIDLTKPSGVKDGLTDYFWNESVNKLLSRYLRYLDPTTTTLIDNSEDKNITRDEVKFENPTIPTKGGVGFRIKDIKNANAGRLFARAISNVVNPVTWVIPWGNIDGKTYSYVRDIDKIPEVLASKKEMQFTHSQNQDSVVGKYIRLLMPKYLRRVEVEDLNRNFWVIAQVISAISAYLFDEDSPISQLIKGMLDELVQIWENLLYLWVFMVLLSKKPETKIHTEVLYISVEDYLSTVKYDRFTRNNDYITQYDENNVDTNADVSALNMLKNVWKRRAQHIKEAYKDSHLCIIPVIRRNNYFENYYSCEQWPGAILYERGQKAPHYQIFNTSSSGKPFTINLKSGEITGISNNKEVYNYLMAAQKENDLELKCMAPVFSKTTKNGVTEYSNNIETFKEISPTPFFFGIRVIPQDIEVKWNSDKEKVSLDKIVLKLEDVMRFSTTEDDTSCVIRTSTFSGADLDKQVFTNVTYGTFTNGFSSEITKKPDIKDVYKGQFLGEVVSYYKNSKEIIFNIRNKNLELPIIREPLFTFVSDGVSLANLNSYSSRILSKIDPTSVLDDVNLDEQVILLTGFYRANLSCGNVGHKQSDDSYTYTPKYPNWSYWYEKTDGTIGTKEFTDQSTQVQGFNVTDGSTTGNLENITISYQVTGGTRDDNFKYASMSRDQIRTGAKILIPGFANPVDFPEYQSLTLLTPLGIRNDYATFVPREERGNVFLRTGKSQVEIETTTDHTHHCTITAYESKNTEMGYAEDNPGNNGRCNLNLYLSKAYYRTSSGKIRPEDWLFVYTQVTAMYMPRFGITDSIILESAEPITNCPTHAGGSMTGREGKFYYTNSRPGAKTINYRYFPMVKKFYMLDNGSIYSSGTTRDPEFGNSEKSKYYFCVVTRIAQHYFMMRDGNRMYGRIEKNRLRFNSPQQNSNMVYWENSFNSKPYNSYNDIIKIINEYTITKDDKGNPQCGYSGLKKEEKDYLLEQTGKTLAELDFITYPYNGYKNK